MKLPRLAVGITGHRPHKLPDLQTGYDWSNPLRCRLREAIRAETARLIAAARPARTSWGELVMASAWSRVEWRRPIAPHEAVGVSGVALGIDQDACGVWWRMGLPYVAAVSFPGQDSRWPPSSRRVYAEVLRLAAGVVYVSATAPRCDDEASAMLLTRDDWTVSACDELIVVWDGSRGGTAATVRKWRRSKDEPTIIDPRDFRN